MTYYKTHTYIYIYCIGRVSPGCCLAEDIFSQHNWIHFCAGDWALSLESKVEHLHVHGLRWTWRGKFEVTTSRNESQSQRVSESHPKCDVLGRIGRRYRRCCCAFQRQSESHSEHVTSRYPHSSSFAFSPFSTCCGLWRWGPLRCQERLLIFSADPGSKLQPWSWADTSVFCFLRVAA